MGTTATARRNRSTRRRPRAVLAAAALGLMLVAAGPAEAQVVDTARLDDRILDPAARGNVSFENTANVASYQQDGILTYRGYQYTGWYRGNRRAVIARRELPNGPWESTELDYDLFSDDSHNTIAMGVTPSDGRLHVAFPTHANAIRYTRSVPDIADNPDEVEWSSTLFERTRNSIPGAPDAPVTYTYPQFEMVDGRMLLTWRDGGSSNGRQALLRYDDNGAGTWSYLGLFTSGAGTYTNEFGSSSSRYGYLHGFSANPVNGNLEIAFTWREQTSVMCPGTGVLVTNHDTGYAYSPDGGVTWLNNDGLEIGTLGSDDLISIDDPHVVESIPIGRGLMNQEAQAFDSKGRLHVMTSRVPERDLDQVGGCVTDFYNDRARLARPYHSFRDHDGSWRTIELPTRTNSSGRTKIIFDRHDTAYVVLPDARIIAATAKSGWTDWRIVFDADDVANVSELIIDRFRIRRDGVLTVGYQEPSANNAPSAYRIADFRLSTREPDRPKQTVPEAPPRPFEGTADDASNLALNGSGDGFPAAFADDSQPSFPPRLVNDGNLGTFWVSAGTEAGQGPTPENPVHVGIDFGEPTTFGELTMIPRPGFGPTAYTVEVSSDGESWTEVAAEPEVHNAELTTAFDPVTARYVRLRITGGYDRIQPPRNVQVVELEVREG